MSEAKFDSGKPKLTLVPRQIIFDIARVREYGVQKYKDPDNWKKVEIERYRDAAFRHFMAYLNDPYGVDDESGLPHLSHLACNIAFLCEMQAEVVEKKPDEIQEKKEKPETYGIFSKDIESYLRTLTDLTESGNEVDKVVSIRSVNGKDRYYIILYHKKEEE